MTLDEAIKHWEEEAEEQERMGERNYDDDCLEYAKEYRQLAKWLRELKRDREILNGLSIYFQSLVVDAAINQRPCMFDMRDATEKERESVKRYIADSTSTTGVNFWSLIEEVNADEKEN